MIVSKRVKTFYTNIWDFRSIYSIKLRAFCSTYSINVWALLSMYTNINVLTFVRCMDLRLNVSLAMDPKSTFRSYLSHIFPLKIFRLRRRRRRQVWTANKRFSLSTNNIRASLTYIQPRASKQMYPCRQGQRLSLLSLAM